MPVTHVFPREAMTVTMNLHIPLLAQDLYSRILHRGAQPLSAVLGSQFEVLLALQGIMKASSGLTFSFEVR